MIMSIIIAIVGGIILAVSYLVFEADTIMQIIALLGMFNICRIMFYLLDFHYVKG